MRLRRRQASKRLQQKLPRQRRPQAPNGLQRHRSPQAPKSRTPQETDSPSSDRASLPATETGPKSPQRLMTAALSQAAVGEIAAIREMGASGDPSYIPVLLEFARFQFRLDAVVGTATYQALEQLLEAYKGAATDMGGPLVELVAGVAGRAPGGDSSPRVRSLQGPVLHPLLQRGGGKLLLRGRSSPGSGWKRSCGAASARGVSPP